MTQSPGSNGTQSVLFAYVLKFDCDLTHVEMFQGFSPDSLRSRDFGGAAKFQGFRVSGFQGFRVSELFFLTTLNFGFMKIIYEI